MLDQTQRFFNPGWRRTHGRPPRGDWHLWVYCCRWHLTIDGRQVAWSESSNAEIAAALTFLEGQPLHTVVSENGRSRFSVGPAVLATSPYDGSEQWMLYARSGEVLVYRADGRYSIGPGDRMPADHVWLPA